MEAGRIEVTWEKWTPSRTGLFLSHKDGRPFPFYPCIYKDVFGILEFFLLFRGSLSQYGCKAGKMSEQLPSRRVPWKNLMDPRTSIWKDEREIKGNFGIILVLLFFKDFFIYLFNVIPTMLGNTLAWQKKNSSNVFA